MIETILTAFPGGPVGLLLIGAMATTGAILMAAFASTPANFDQRQLAIERGRLPAATKLENVHELLAGKLEEVAGLEARLVELRGQITDADRARLEYEHWRSLAEVTKEEYANLAAQRQEIDTVRDEFERLAGLLAERRAELATIVAERDEVARRLEDLKKQILELDDRKAELADVEARVAEATKKRDALRTEIAELDERSAELLRIKFEVGELAKRKSDLMEFVEKISAQIPELQQKRAALEAEIAKLSIQVDGLYGLRTEYAAIDAKLADLRPRLAGLEAEVRRIEADRDGLAAEAAGLRTTIATDRTEADRLHQIVISHRAEAEALESRRAELSAHIANLEKRIGAIEPGVGGTGKVVDTKETLADLFVKPSCLFADGRALLTQAETVTDERKQLDAVRAYLDGLGLVFNERVLLRFHTSLKIGRISPLTVLAGISGTGKSQLPQRYAEAMGIHFLKLAVQPRWDSPQDLLGFYNYLEKKYKATDLARALLCMDGTLLGKDIENGGSMYDRVLLVLLDEMNIARVEYYFSEFLSRLEGRPEHGDPDESKKRASRIEIEVPGMARTVSIYPGHNVLFAGTMNQDESTQSLSDKVMDRGNTLLFRKPDSISHSGRSEAGSQGGEIAKRHLPLSSWLSWQKDFKNLPLTTREYCEKFVERMNLQCKDARRPFGHRIADSIFAYVANHPHAVTEGGLRFALADMVEMRLLPKLGGVTTEGKAGMAIQTIAQVVGGELGDTELAERINGGLDGDSFSWTAA